MVYLVIMIRRIILLIFSSLPLFAPAAYCQTESEIEAEYARRIQQEMLYGVYIPADLEEAYDELSRLADPAGIIEFKSAPEDSIRRKLHFGLGRWIMINWGLEEGSRISHHLRLKGVSVPDDMVRIIIVTWHRKLNNLPTKLEEEIALVKERMEAEKARRDADKTEILLEKRPHKEK
jgi:hypothetical protein